jgi:hypothetical protein
MIIAQHRKRRVLNGFGEFVYADPTGSTDDSIASQNDPINMGPLQQLTTSDEHITAEVAERDDDRIGVERDYNNMDVAERDDDRIVLEREHVIPEGPGPGSGPAVAWYKTPLGITGIALASGTILTGIIVAARK